LTLRGRESLSGRHRKNRLLVAGYKHQDNEEMKKENIILITMDAVRPDRLSCYGYDKIETKGIDAIAAEGALFKNCIATSCLTPIACASILSGKNPDKTTVRDPFCKVKTKTITELLKEQEYKTAGFIGIDIIDSRHDFHKSFDYFDEPSPEGSFHTMWFKRGTEETRITMGSWWIDRMFKWLNEHSGDNFFIWGHYFHVHFLAEKELLHSGKLDGDKLSDYAYLDAKMKYMDEHLFQPLVKTLKDLGIWDDTTIIVTSDHGETLCVKQPTWKTFYLEYPQHKTMYESDLKVPLIIKNKNLTKAEVDHTVRSIDIVPTLVDLLNIPTDEKFDGLSLMPLLAGEKFPELTAYSEELFENRGQGSLQAVRTPRYKLIRNITKGELEFYDLQKDPDEGTNILDSCSVEEKRTVKEFMGIMDEFLKGYEVGSELSEEDRKQIEERLRGLGYI
jgi:arylsulfatase A-like enzyme